MEIKWLMGYENLKDVLNIRRKVFINEQGVPEELEIDGSDIDAIHLLLLDNNIPVGTGRIILINEEYTLGRIAVLNKFRKKGYGKVIVENLINKAYDIGGFTQYLHAQKQVVSFYEKIGFQICSKEYKEAGIVHLSMFHTGRV